MPRCATSPSAIRTRSGRRRGPRPNAGRTSWSSGSGAGAPPARPLAHPRGTTAARAHVANLGVNGFTARDVIETELPRLDRLRPEFASILVGVNDIVQGVPEAT